MTLHNHYFLEVPILSPLHTEQWFISLSVSPSPFAPSGHPGGGSHLSISHCCSDQLFWSNVHPGRHLRWGQMLLHRCFFIKLNRFPPLGRCCLPLQGKPEWIGTRCDIFWALGLAHDMSLDLCECVYGGMFTPTI